MKRGVRADFMSVGVQDAALLQERLGEAPLNEISQHGVLRFRSVEDLDDSPVDLYSHSNVRVTLTKVHISYRKYKQSLREIHYSILYIAFCTRAFFAGFILPKFHLTENIA